MVPIRRLLLVSYGSPTDQVMLSAAVRDLHLGFPGEFITSIKSYHPEIWALNPYVTNLDDDDPTVQVIPCGRPPVGQSEGLSFHFVHAYRMLLSRALDIGIKPTSFQGDIHLSDEEKSEPSDVDRALDATGVRYWVVVTGSHKNATVRRWPPSRYQDVVDHFRDRILFVQAGAERDRAEHPRLKNVLDLVGKTDLRQLIRLIHFSDGVLCPISLFSHLAAAVEVPPNRRRCRPCVVVAGGSEPSQWNAYPQQFHLHRSGTLPCCDNGGCWRSHVLPIDQAQTDNNKACMFPTQTPDGTYAKCMETVSSQEVIGAIENYLKFDTYAWRGIHRLRVDAAREQFLAHVAANTGGDTQPTPPQSGDPVEAAER
jgi:ADP-heptose:LPS heptosyltransferase